MSDTPKAPPGFKYMPCRFCEKPMLVGAKRYKPPAHIECSTAVQMDNIRQMNEKKGPFYDKWLEGQLKYLETLRGGGPPGTSGG